MAIIKVNNLLHEDAPKTRLSFAEVSGTNVIRWDNPAGLNAQWALQLGEIGGEQTEVVLLNSSTPSGTAGTLAANTLYEHSADTPVYGIKFDQIVFERSTTGTTGTASPMTGGTVTYQPNNSYTIFDDTSGASTYGYRTYFRNSALAVNSTESDWTTFAGPEFYSLFKIRERAKEKLWDASWLTDSLVDNWINECKDIMVNKVVQSNEDYTIGTESVAFGTDGLGTITSTDFSNVRRVWVTYDGVNKYQSTKMDFNSFLPTQYFSSVHPYHAFQGNNVLLVKPSDRGTAEVSFYRFGTTMVNDTDTLPIPMRSYTNIFVDYVYAQALGKDEKFTQKDNQMQFVNAQIGDFIQSLTGRDKTGPTMVDMVEAVTGDDTVYT